MLANTESKTELKSTERWCAKMSRSVTPYLLSYAVCPLRPRVMCVMTCMIVFFFKLTDAWVSILDREFKIKAEMYQLGTWINFLHSFISY